MHPVFNRDFDRELEQEQRREERSAEAYFTSEDMEKATARARAEGFANGCAKGHASGTAETRATLDARRAAALDALAPRLDQLLAEADAHRRTLERQTLDFALSICQQVFPEFLHSRSHDRAAEQIRRTLGMALGSGRLRIRLSPAALVVVGPSIESLAAARGHADRLDLAADAALSDGDAQVQWDSGFMEYSFEAVCDRILATLRKSRAEFTSTTPKGSDQHV